MALALLRLPASLSVLAICSAAGAVSVPFQASAETLIRLGHTLTTNDVRHAAAEFFGELVHERTDGAVRVEVFPSSQLGDVVEVFEGLNLGTVQMTIAGSTHLANVVPEFGVFDLPYLAPDVASFVELIDGEVGQALLERLPDVGMRGLTFSNVSFRHIYTRSPVASFDDMTGLVIRVPGNPVYSDSMQAFGARPTPMALGEVFSAIQQGAIAGAENSAALFFNSGHYEVAPYVALTYHAALPTVFLISEVFWQGLDPETQEIVQQSAREAGLFERENSAEVDEQALAELPNRGVTIHEVDLAPFIASVGPVYERHRARLGDELMDLVTGGLN
jgi:TRAP-type transport system periplasmic protein